MPDYCNPPIHTLEAGTESADMELRLITEDPHACWRICDAAGDPIVTNCVGRCALGDDAARPLPEEISWGVPPRDTEGDYHDQT